MGRRCYEVMKWTRARKMACTNIEYTFHFSEECGNNASYCFTLWGMERKISKAFPSEPWGSGVCNRKDLWFGFNPQAGRKVDIKPALLVKWDRLEGCGPHRERYIPVWGPRHMVKVSGERDTPSTSSSPSTTAFTTSPRCLHVYISFGAWWFPVWY